MLSLLVLLLPNKLKGLSKDFSAGSEIKGTEISFGQTVGSKSSVFAYSQRYNRLSLMFF